MSSIRTLNGGGPQGVLWGILEYLSQSNNNTDFPSENKKFKFIDELSILEIINLISIGISSNKFTNHVASDIPRNGYFVPPDNLLTQQYLEQICNWTSQNKMKLNTRKTNAMIFNFANEFQFSTRVSVENEVMDIIGEAKLLGVIINNDLSWDSNTNSLVKRANTRMRILHKLVEFDVPVEDLVTIYVLYIRSILEQSCHVWHSSLTLEITTDLERVQKNSLKIILQQEYSTYEKALEHLNIDSLYNRRNSKNKTG